MFNGARPVSGRFYKRPKSHSQERQMFKCAMASVEQDIIAFNVDVNLKPVGARKPKRFRHDFV